MVAITADRLKNPLNCCALRRSIICSAICQEVARRTGCRDGGGLCAAKLCAGRGLPVRLVARDRADQLHDGHREGGASPALPHPDPVSPTLSTPPPDDPLPLSQPP